MPTCTQDPTLDIGHSVRIAVRRIDGEIDGVAYWHSCKGEDAYGYIPVGSPEWWQLISENPLSIQPSILCPLCGHHGYIRDGKWVPA